MLTLTEKQAVRAQARHWRQAGERVALVPTMGNLHAGHLQLVREARAHADRVVVSIFVNPLQFAAGEDLDTYPRTLDADARALAELGVDLLFVPSATEMLPLALTEATSVDVPGLSGVLCGFFRPGHFRGVATIVLKLLHLVQPDYLCLGQKDYQQIAVIRKMVRDLDVSVDIIAVPTVRAEDGLALSSRNNYLTTEERLIAPHLYEALCVTAGALKGDPSNWRSHEQAATHRLLSAGFKPDYVAIRNAADLTLPDQHTHAWVILAAAFLGKTRLIDNLDLTL